MSADRPQSAIAVLAFHNEDGEIGFAGRLGVGEEWQFVSECLQNDWIRYKADRSYREITDGKIRRRHIYQITDAGREALARSREPDHA